MREIKFRMWSKMANKFFDQHAVALECLKQQILGEYDHCEDGDSFEQFTGLLDKNGKEIYEGDILYYVPFDTHANDRIVLFEDGSFVLQMKRSGFKKIISEENMENFTVIGNVHEGVDA